MNPEFLTCFGHAVATPTRKPESGAASLRIELRGGTVTLVHGQDGSVLKGPFPVTEGYWDRLWEAASKDIS